MGYRQLVEKSVRMAFRKIDDLGINVVFRSNKAEGFDFETLSADVTAQQVLNLRAIQLKSAKKSRSEDNMAVVSSTIEAKLLMISKDTPSLNSYDTVEFDGYTWNVVHPIDNNGYTVTVTVTREA